LGWVFRDFLIQIIGNPLFDSGRGSIAGPAWKLTRKVQVLSPSHYGNEEEAGSLVPLAVRSTPDPHR